MDGMVVRAWGSNVDDGYEVIATRDLPVGHHVFEVPRDVAVRLDSTHSDFKERIRDHPNFWDNCAFREGSRPFAELTVMALYVGGAHDHTRCTAHVVCTGTKRSTCRTLSGNPSGTSCLPTTTTCPATAPTPNCTCCAAAVLSTVVATDVGTPRQRDGSHCLQ